MTLQSQSRCPIRWCSGGSSNGTALAGGVSLSLYQRPLPERVAAVFVARHLSESGGDSSAARLDGEAVISLTDFLRRMPSLTRDAMFQSGQDPAAYIAGCQLLEMRYRNEDGSWVSRDESPKKSGMHYGAMQYVRLCADPHEVLEAAMADDDASPTATEAEGSETTMSKDEMDGGAYEVEVEALAAVLQRFEGSRTSRWFTITEAVMLARREGLRYSSAHPLRFFLKTDMGRMRRLLQSSCTSKYLWARVDEKLVAYRRPGEELCPVVEPTSASSGGDDTNSRSLPSVARTTKASVQNSYGGWGSAQMVPTKEDVYEMLRFVPVNWGNFGLLDIPGPLKRRHIRCSSVLQWFRRQPHYFELRNMNGTVEIRRSVLLHPEQHGLTADQAISYVEQGILSGLINCLVVLGPDGKPLVCQSTVEKNIQKFFYRVCPGYFVPFDLILQRALRKTVTLRELMELVRQRPEDFEVVTAVGLGAPLVRKRSGANSARWKTQFIDDLTSRPDDIPIIGIVCHYVCATWDRPEYAYVRMTAAEQCTVGGFEGMMDVVQRHPEIFRLGKQFFCRVDSSDPSFKQQPEPSENEMTSRTYQRDENPYFSTKELAKVFHYIASTDEAYTAAFFLRASSPAMRIALPPRIISVFQESAHQFACKETSPGVFSIRKIQLQKPKAPLPPLSRTSPRTTGAVASTMQSDGAVGEEDEDGSWLNAEEIEERPSKGKIIEAVRQLIPPAGVDHERLLLWISLHIQQAINAEYGSLLKMLEKERTHFHVSKTEDGTTVSLVNA